MKKPNTAEKSGEVSSEFTDVIEEQLFTSSNSMKIFRGHDVLAKKWTKHDISKAFDPMVHPLIDSARNYGFRIWILGKYAYGAVLN